MSDVADILRAAADLLEPEGAWTRDTLARDEDCRSVGYASPDACSWCVAGAIRKVAGDEPAAQPALDHLARYLGGRGLPFWNDAQTGPEPVLAALRAAAEKAS